MVPILQWWYTENIEAMENIHARTNHAFINHMIQKGGKAMKHPDFNEKYEDSSHLSLIGNDNFDTFQGAVCAFINYPEIGVYSVV